MENTLESSTELNPSPNAEAKVLKVSTTGCLVIGCVGVVSAVLSSSQAILLDGLFNIIYFATGLFTLRIARLVQRGGEFSMTA